MPGFSKHEEIVAWQLCEELKLRIFRMLAKATVAKDFDFCKQIRKSSRAAPALIAEGFARRRDTEFARYLEMALGELAETRNHLRDGAHCGHFTVDEFRDCHRLCFRARQAAIGLIRYLRKEGEEEEEADPT